MNSQVLIHVGLHKTGTTWLQRWMAAHPSIAYRLDSFGGIQRPIDLCRTAMADQPSWYAISDENLTGGRIWPEGYTSLLLRHAARGRGAGLGSRWDYSFQNGYQQHQRRRRRLEPYPLLQHQCISIYG